MRIGLNAGHTLNGPGSGAVGVLNESVETRRIVQAITPMFQAAGCEVVDCTVDKAASQSAYLQEVVKMANRQDLDWFISFHLNNDAAQKGKGVEAYTYQGRQYPDAVEVCELIAALGFKNRGVKAGSGLYVIRKTKAKSILFEICFVNEPDAAVEVCELIAALGFKNRGVKAGSGLYVIRKTKAKSILFEICFVNEPDASTYQRQFDEICKAIVYGLADYVGAVTKPEPPSALPEKKQYVRVKCDNLSVRSKPSWADDAVCGTVRKNEVFTISEGPIIVGNGKMYRLKSGVYITAADKYVDVYEK